TNLEGPTDFAIDPTNGDICYVAIAAGTVRRILYAGFDNLPPVAVVSVAADSGAAPFTATFSSLGSHDPEGSPLYYLWHFGDGTFTDQPNPSHLYPAAGIYQVVLSAIDTLGGTGYDTVTVTVTGSGAFPATPVRDRFERPDGPVGGQWADNVTSLAIVGGALTQNGPPSPSGIWNGQVFGSDQEAYVTLGTLTPGCRRYSL